MYRIRQVRVLHGARFVPQAGHISGKIGCDTNQQMVIQLRTLSIPAIISLTNEPSSSGPWKTSTVVKSNGVVHVTLICWDLLNVVKSAVGETKDSGEMPARSDSFRLLVTFARFVALSAPIKTDNAAISSH